MNERSELETPLNKEAFFPLESSKSQGTNSGAMETFGSASGFGRSVARRFFKSPVAMASLCILALLVAGAICLPLIWPYDFATQEVSNGNRPFFSQNPGGGFVHVFGTDQLGRDVFARIWYGARVSFLVAGAVAMIDGVMGVAYGCLSGYFGGKVDMGMMRFLEVVSGIPYLMIVLLLSAMLPRGIGTLILAYTLVGWTSMALLVRGQVVSLMNREFVIAAKTIGTGMRGILFHHVLPNILGIILVHITLSIPGILFTEAFLSMMGMGIPPPYPSLGGMINEGVTIFQTNPVRLVAPGALICLTMLSLNLLGDQLQDALDPKEQGRRTAPSK